MFVDGVTCQYGVVKPCVKRGFKLAHGTRAGRAIRNLDGSYECGVWSGLLTRISEEPRSIVNVKCPILTVRDRSPSHSPTATQLRMSVSKVVAELV